MIDPKLCETMRAELRPDCYGGETCDQIVHRWFAYAEGDKEGDDSIDPLQLSARTFPPGTKVVVSEPLCPQCGETRSVIYPVPKTGPLFADNCDCGFDWKNWTLDHYS